jgi:hypothetical protein
MLGDMGVRCRGKPPLCLGEGDIGGHGDDVHCVAQPFLGSHLRSRRLVKQYGECLAGAFILAPVRTVFKEAMAEKSPGSSCSRTCPIATSGYTITRGCRFTIGITARRAPAAYVACSTRQLRKVSGLGTCVFGSADIVHTSRNNHPSLPLHTHPSPMATPGGFSRRGFLLSMFGPTWNCDGAPALFRRFLLLDGRAGLRQHAFVLLRMASCR